MLSSIPPPYPGYPTPQEILINEPPPSYIHAVRSNLPMVHRTTIPTGIPSHLLHATRANRNNYQHRNPPPSYTESELRHGRRNRYASMIRAYNLGRFSRQPCLANCRNCGFITLTTIRHFYSRQAHSTCFALCVCGCIPCCWFPYAVKSCKETRHYCSACQKLVGVYNPWELTNTGEQRVRRATSDGMFRLC